MRFLLILMLLWETQQPKIFGVVRNMVCSVLRQSSTFETMVLMPMNYTYTYTLESGDKLRKRFQFSTIVLYARSIPLLFVFIVLEIRRVHVSITCALI